MSEEIAANKRRVTVLVVGEVVVVSVVLGVPAALLLGWWALVVVVVLAAPLGPRFVGWVVQPGREALADAQGVSITRYPPGLLAALEKVDVASVVMRPRSRTIAHLWLVPPETGPAQRPSLDERIEALKEL